MYLKRHIKDIPTWILIASALILLGFALTVNTAKRDMDRVAERTGKIIEKRLSSLEGYMKEALAEDRTQWMSLEKLPDDMVIYRYVGDTLQSWANQFTTANDDIGGRMMFQRLSSASPVSPLAEVTEQIDYVNYGPKWYLVKSISEKDCKVIGGLEIKNTLVASPLNGINPKLHLNASLSIQPLAFSDGSAVYVDGKPLIKVASEASIRQLVVTNTGIIWLALLLFLCGTLAYVLAKRDYHRLIKAIAGLTVITLTIYLWGHTLQGNPSIFSPTVYADGAFLYSLGAVLIVNLYLTLTIACTYITRYSIMRRLFSRRSDKVIYTFSAIHILLIIGIAVYTHLTLKSIIMNSSISLELYKLSTLSIYSGVVYASYILLITGIILMMQMLRPYCKKLFGWDVNFFSGIGRSVTCVAVAAYLVIISSVLGFQKEQNRVNVWANRLSIDRDISLEIRLKSVENQIEQDALIATLSTLQNSGNIILKRISENYLYRVSQDYDISVLLFSDSDMDPAIIQLFNERIRNAQHIADNSRFAYSYNANGHIRYTGLFSYITKAKGVTRMMVGVEPKSNKEDMGYSSILGFSSPGKVVIQPFYSYAKYISSRLVTFKGDYAYPTVLSEKLKKDITDSPNGQLRLDGYVHFTNKISDDEEIFISRKAIEKYKYMTELFFFAIISYLLMTLIGMDRKKRKTFEKNYYKSRINTVLMVSLIITLITMASISVIFVNSRNNANLKSIMTNKVNAIQAIMESGSQGAASFRDLSGQPVARAMEDVGAITKTDVTLYTPSGRAFTSTTPEVFDKMIIGSRINEGAYENIIYKHKRYYIDKEKIGNNSYYALSAPLFNSDGKLVALMSAPYTDESFDFKSAATMNIAAVVTVFIILLIFTRLMTSTVVNKMFRPLIDIGDKMNAADINNLEYIIYERDDELSSLVRAYDLMVHYLSESTKQLAQVEREKAWSEMARQVAHEIKNPLTPMKLQIQRIQRLKDLGRPGWQDKFDEAAAIILEEIEILSRTAEEFSNFAKLYSETPVEIDLDKMLKEVITLFDNKDNIAFSYIGLEHSMIMGPKPQLTRTFVNLLTNAVQSIENQQQKDVEEGAKPAQGSIFVSLRNSVKPNYFDVVVEDNGPGVPEENRAKLFTPNFTTKSAGSGLGLAICKNILENCNGDIQYSKSFSLNGACFTVHYPKNSPSHSER